MNGDKLKALRLSRGWSLRVMSERCSIPVGNIAVIETGRYCPTLRQIEKLAQALQVSPEYLIKDWEGIK